MIPEPSDQIRHRKNKGSRGGRPVSFDAHDYKNRNVVERAFNHFKNWRGLASRYDKYGPGLSRRCGPGSDRALAVMTYETRPSRMAVLELLRPGVVYEATAVPDSERNYRPLAEVLAQHLLATSKRPGEAAINAGRTWTGPRSAASTAPTVQGRPPRPRSTRTRPSPRSCGCSATSASPPN